MVAGRSWPAKISSLGQASSSSSNSSLSCWITSLQIAKISTGKAGPTVQESAQWALPLHRKHSLLRRAAATLATLSRTCVGVRAVSQAAAQWPCWWQRRQMELSAGLQGAGEVSQAWEHCEGHGGGGCWSGRGGPQLRLKPFHGIHPGRGQSWSTSRPTGRPRRVCKRHSPCPGRLARGDTGGCAG